MMLMAAMQTCHTKVVIAHGGAAPQQLGSALYLGSCVMLDGGYAHVPGTKKDRRMIVSICSARCSSVLQLCAAAGCRLDEFVHNLAVRSKHHHNSGCSHLHQHQPSLHDRQSSRTAAIGQPVSTTQQAEHMGSKALTTALRMQHAPCANPVNCQQTNPSAVNACLKNLQQSPSHIPQPLPTPLAQLCALHANATPKSESCRD